MHITILALGTRGDAQPLIALGLGLISRGFYIKFIIDVHYVDLVEKYSLNYVPIKDIEYMFQQGTIIDKMNQCFEACEGSDALIFSPHPFSFIGYHIAEKLDVPCFWAVSFPMHHIDTIPHSLLPGLNIYGFYNRNYHHILNHWREKYLHLYPFPLYPPTPPWQRIYDQKLPFLYFFSPHIFAKPSYWLEQVHITGFWFLDADPNWIPPSDLLEFLNAGLKPLYFGFGSVFDTIPETLFDLILKTLALTNMRAIVHMNKNQIDINKLPDNVFIVESIPHDWLFHKVAAVIHHGGLNTCGAVLRAGVPFVLVPFMTDGPLWAYLLKKGGLCPAPIMHNDLTAEKLAAAIHKALNDEGIHTNLSAMNQKINEENGVRNAVDIIERYLS